MKNKPTVVSSKEPKSVSKGLILIWTSATTFSKLVGILLLVLAVISFVQFSYFKEQQKSDVECQTEFVEQIGLTLDARSSAVDANNRAIDELFYSVRDFANDPTPKEKIELDKAFASYESTRRAVIESKKANPYPEISLTELCNR